MNDYEESRRRFLSKLGLAIGTSIVAGEKLSGAILHDKTDFVLSTEQQQFMANYERWMDSFIPAIQAQRENPDNLQAKQSIMDLSTEADKWRDKLTDYMKDENFARYYMTVTERLTKEIY